jgi:hypothetical protein
MDFDFEVLFKKENKGLCRWLGPVLLALPLLWGIGDGSVRSEGIRGWFGELFLVSLCLQFMLGLLLSLSAFGRRKEENH